MSDAETNAAGPDRLQLESEPPSAAPEAFLSQFQSRLVVTASTQVLGAGAGRFCVENLLSGRGVEVGREGLELLRYFAQPRTAAAAIERSSLESTRARELITNFETLGILRAAGMHNRLPPRPTSRPGACLYRVPFADPLEAPLAADFCFFGVPYEGGRTGLAGAALGPDTLRLYSQRFPALSDLGSGRSSGWYDYDARRQVLREAALVDAGNVVVAPGESPSALFQRISELVEAIVLRRAIPVGLGGDHSITAPILRGFGGREVTVVQFDAHTDLENVVPPEILHHGNVMRRARELPGVQEIIAFGLRGFGTSPEGIEPWKLKYLSARELQERGEAAMLDLIPPGRPIYVTVDLDVLDPSHVPAVGTPLPGGLHPALLKDLLWSLGRSADVIGFDFVELSPRDGSEVSLSIANELILTLAGAVFERLCGRGET